MVFFRGVLEAVGIGAVRRSYRVRSVEADGLCRTMRLLWASGGVEGQFLFFWLSVKDCAAFNEILFAASDRPMPEPKFALVTLAPLMSAPLRSARRRSAPRRLAPLRLA